MASDKIYDKIHEQSPWQDITEGNKIFEAATSRISAQESGERQLPCGPLSGVNNVCCVHPCARIHQYQ